VTALLAIATALLVSCGDPTPTAGDPLGAWPADPRELVAFCPTLPYPELVTTCRVQAAADLGRAGQGDEAAAVCVAIPAGTWREECHFRAGEELGRAGHTVPALQHCAKAGWFGRNCLTHAGWNLPPDLEIGPNTDAARVASAAEELQNQVEHALDGAGDGLPGEGRDLVMARFGYNVFVGRGAANPAAAHLDGPVGAVLRTGFAIEAVRLLSNPAAANGNPAAAKGNPAAANGDPAVVNGDPTVESVRAVWTGEGEPLVGPPLPAHARMGRYAQHVPSPHETGVPHVPTYGGGARLIGQTTDEDLDIAALEALFWHESTPADAFVPWLDDPRDRVRWTAARLVRLAGPIEIDLPALLTRLAADHPDQNVRWHAQFGLDNRTWERRALPRR
jgi:hypothetical protein